MLNCDLVILPPPQLTIGSGGKIQVLRKRSLDVPCLGLELCHQVRPIIHWEWKDAKLNSSEFTRKRTNDPNAQPSRGLRPHFHPNRCELRTNPILLGFGCEQARKSGERMMDCEARSTRCVVRIRGASCVNVSKRFVESDTYSLL